MAETSPVSVLEVKWEIPTWPILDFSNRKYCLLPVVPVYLLNWCIISIPKHGYLEQMPDGL